MTQATTIPTPPPPPNVPVLAGGDAPVAATRALTAQDIVALRARRSELSNQLTSAASRRRSLSNELNGTADPSARAGLESRIAVLDKRMVQLEGDMAQTGQILSSEAASRVTSTQPAHTFLGMDAVYAAPLTGIFIIFVLGPLAIGAARMMWKRSSRPVLPAGSAESAERMSRMEQSVDAIAVEVERISEGQRFVTKLLSEKAALLPGVNEKLKDTTQYEVP
ncbi:MAG: hypothetical protein M3Z17_12220 [Gemmatimonadota bacterium]|nr:hypothetical protein [Gemmatimonadota bacterium]